MLDARTSTRPLVGARRRATAPLALTVLVASAAFSSCSSAGSGAAGAPRQRVVMTDDRAAITTDHGTVITAGSDVPTGATVAAPPARVLPALVRAYEELGVRATVVDTTNFRVGVEGLVRRRTLGKAQLSQYVRCGERMNVPRADTDRVVLSIMTTVRPLAAGESRLETLISADAQDLQAARSEAGQHCTSTGAFEQRLHAAVGLAVLTG